MPLGKGAIQLYDLQSDIGESRDLAQNHPEVVRQAAAIMDANHTPSGYWVPELNPRPFDEKMRKPRSNP
jgi:hypothetical protein